MNEEPTQTETQTESPIQTQTQDGWNGELASLASQEWYAKIPEEVRPLVEGGLKTKWTNLEGGYSKKFQSLAEERKSWEGEKKSLSERLQAQEREALLFKDLFGQPEQESLARFETEKKELLDKLSALENEVAPLREYKTNSEKQAQLAYEAQVKAEADKLSEAYKDIVEHKDEKVFDTFSKLVQAGIDYDEAASITRKKFDVSTPQPPKSALLASRGDAPGARDAIPEGLSPAEMIARAAANAARKYGA